MKIGKLNKRIAIQQLTATNDDGGGNSEEWTTLATVYASIRPITGDRRFYAQHIEAVVDSEVKIRYRKGVNSTMRVVCPPPPAEGDMPAGTKILNIRAAFDPDGKSVELVMLCQEELADGG